MEQSSVKSGSCTSYNIVFYIVLIFILLLIIYAIYTLLYPTIPINKLKKFFNIRGDPDLTTDATEIRPFTTTVESSYTYSYTYTKNIYYLTKATNVPNKLIIDLPGGAFIYCSNSLKAYLNLPDLNIDVVSLEYPVLPQGNAIRAILYLEAAITSVIEEYTQKWGTSDFEIYLSTASAGSYYGVKIINNGKFRKYIRKFSSASGYFGYKTLDNVFTALGDKLYLRRLQDNTLFDCSPLPEGIIDTFYAIDANDALKISTINFLQKTGQEMTAHTYYGAGHCFYLHFNSLDTKQYYQDYMNFINS